MIKINVDKCTKEIQFLKKILDLKYTKILCKNSNFHFT